MHSIERTFHPVGQGGFCSEKHVFDGRKFNIVYDCGNFGCKARVANIAKKAFAVGENIDILFVSHFDTDHVSLISSLIPYQTCRIKKVVLPLLKYCEECDMMAGYYLAAADGRARSALISSVDLIRDPDKFFPGTQIIYVDTAREGMLDEEERDNLVRGDLHERRGLQLHRSLFGLDSPLDDWVFVPYNYDYLNRHMQLIVKLVRWLSTVKGSMSDLSDPGFVNKYRRELKGIYASAVMGGINENSMLLYSGPRDGDLRKYEVERDGKVVDANVGCVYTGDVNLNVVNLNIVYAQYLNSVGVVQVPHHGSELSFLGMHFPATKRLCPVLYGQNNHYGHPADEVGLRVTASGGLYKRVTEDPKTVFTERITMI